MQVSDFPGCCGAHVIHNLGDDPELTMRKIRQEFRDTGESRTGAILAITNRDHQPLTEAALLRIGFTPAFQFRSHSTGATLNLWALQAKRAQFDADEMAG